MSHIGYCPCPRCDPDGFNPQKSPPATTEQKKGFVVSKEKELEIVATISKVSTLRRNGKQKETSTKKN